MDTTDKSDNDGNKRARTMFAETVSIFPDGGLPVVVCQSENFQKIFGSNEIKYLMDIIAITIENQRVDIINEMMSMALVKNRRKVRKSHMCLIDGGIKVIHRISVATRLNNAVEGRSVYYDVTQMYLACERHRWTSEYTMIRTICPICNSAYDKELKRYIHENLGKTQAAVRSSITGKCLEYFYSNTLSPRKHLEELSNETAEMHQETQHQRVILDSTYENTTWNVNHPVDMEIQEDMTTSILNSSDEKSSQRNYLSRA